VQQWRGSAAAGAAARLAIASRRSNIRMPPIEPRLNAKDKALVRLFMAACFHRWELLEGASTCRIGRAASHANDTAAVTSPRLLMACQCACRPMTESA